MSRKHNSYTWKQQCNISRSPRKDFLDLGLLLSLALSSSEESDRQDTQGQDSTSGSTSDGTTPPVATGSPLEGTVPTKNTGNGLVDITNRGGAVGVEAENDDSGNRGLHGNMNTSATPCKTTNQSSTLTYPEDFTPNESLHPSLGLSPALYVPLYSDWNSALATWGFAWEAHIYGLGSVFTVFGLISVVCLLGLPLRCPPGCPYLTLLHLFLLAFAGIQAFCLLYDAYNHQDRLPPIGSLLLSELPFPCLVSAFSLAFLILSLRSRMHLSLPLAISTSFSVLPKPRLLLCVSLLYFGVSLGCVGMLQLFHILPTMILLFPHGLFVCLTIFLSFSYLIFYCLIRVDSKHIYRLNDNGESGGSPEGIRSASCPFAKVEDWQRAAGAGVGAALCMLGCGGLQLYGILHALGLGGVEGYGFQPWSWWGYQYLWFSKTVPCFFKSFFELSKPRYIKAWAQFCRNGLIPNFFLWRCGSRENTAQCKMLPTSKFFDISKQDTGAMGLERERLWLNPGSVLQSQGARKTALTFLGQQRAKLCSAQPSTSDSQPVLPQALPYLELGLPGNPGLWPTGRD
ncbi:unnamed protein product [Pleuronectes platessa]|uniref:Proline-rich transmembrane protein 3/4 domain-containing protein n=1 Tax=Pleuronectes platessa TaxID=8262 RepID=A0A9N7YGX7_PLEPL|nr:unnamed protein product [Pleuronectes platessa]